MGGSYSIALRERAIKFVEAENGSPKEACAVLGIHSSTLTKWLKRYRQTGEIAPRPRHNYRTQKVDIEALKQNIRINPDATLPELAVSFGVFPSTIFYHLKKLGITRKKNHALCRTKRRKKA
jgi:transposase